MNQAFILYIVLEKCVYSGGKNKVAMALWSSSAGFSFSSACVLIVFSIYLCINYSVASSEISDTKSKSWKTNRSLTETRGTIIDKPESDHFHFIDLIQRFNHNQFPICCISYSIIVLPITTIFNNICHRLTMLLVINE